MDGEMTRRVCVVCWIAKAIDTHSEYAIAAYCSSTATTATRTRLKVAFRGTLPVHCLYIASHCLYIACTLSIHCLYIASTLPVHCLYIACILPVHCLYIACILPVHCLYIACILPVYCLLFLFHSTRIKE
jgi:hypothetical protein